MILNLAYTNREIYIFNEIESRAIYLSDLSVIILYLKELYLQLIF